MTARAALATAVVLTFVSNDALAVPRRRFEPGDLELSKRGEIDADLQFAALAGEGDEVDFPDFEVAFGLADNVQLEVDGAFAYVRRDGVSDLRADNLWPSAKLGLADFGAQATGALSFGMQLGPKIAIDVDNRGVGYETVLLAGYNYRRYGGVLNIGGLIDPGESIRRHHNGIEGGIDVHLDLDSERRFVWLTELGGTHFLSRDADQLHLSFGVSCSTAKHVDFSVMALAALIDGGGRKVGLLLGVSPNFVLFE